MGHGSNDPELNSAYYGYETNKNTDLVTNRQMAYRTGAGDITHYNTQHAGEDEISRYRPTMDRSKMPGADDDEWHLDPSNIGDSQWGRNSPDAGDDAHKAAHYVSDDDKYSKIMEGNTIEHIRHRILGQNAKGAGAIADQWRTIHGNLFDLFFGVKDPTDKLLDQGSWTGDAAKAFVMMGPGATLKSLSDWMTAAEQNIKAFNHLSTIIPGYHHQIDVLYQEYKNELRSEAVNYFKEQDTMIRDPNGGPSFRNVDELMAHGTMEEKGNFISNMKDVGAIYSLRAQDIEFAMAQDYQTAITMLYDGSSTRYEGPSNAIMDAPGFVPPNLNFGPGPGPGPGPAPTFKPANLAKPNVAPPPNMTDASVAKPGPPPETPALDAPPVTDQPPAPGAPPVAPNTAPPALGTPPAPALAPPVPVARTGPTEVGPGRAPAPRPTTQNAFRPNANRPPGLNRSGVLGDRGASRPTAPSGDSPGGRPNASRPPASPAKPARTGKTPGRPGEPEAGRGGGRPGSRPPGSPQGTKGKPGQQQQRPGAPGELDENNAFRRPSGGTSPSVLDNKRIRPPDPASEDAQRLSGRPGSGPPNTTKPVLNNRGPKQGRKPERQQSRPGGPTGGLPADNVFVPPPSGTAPVLENPTQWMRPGAPADTSEVPNSLRGPARMPSGANLSSSRPGTDSAAELAARKAAQREQERRKKADEEFEKIRAWMNGEEAFAVETPGGPVVSSHAPTPEQLAHPKPTLGGA